MGKPYFASFLYLFSADVFSFVIIPTCWAKLHLTLLCFWRVQLYRFDKLFTWLYTILDWIIRWKLYYSHHLPAGSANVFHYSDVVMGAMASQITSLTIVESTVYSGADQRKHQSSTSLAFVRGIHRWPVNSPHKGPVTRKMFPLMTSSCTIYWPPGDVGTRGLSWWSVKCVSINGLPSVIKPLREPMMTDIYDAIWRHWGPVASSYENGPRVTHE